MTMLDLPPPRRGFALLKREVGSDAAYGTWRCDRSVLAVSGLAQAKEL